MDDILKQLISSELLSEETKNEIAEGFTNAVEEMRSTLREEIEADVKTQLVQEWTTQRNALIESIDEMVTAALEEELSELKSEIDSYRDLEVEYAQRITEEKEKMATVLAEEIDTLVDKLDQFLELRLEAEFSELKEDISEAKQNLFGRKIFESFAREYTKNFVDEESLQSQVNVLESQLANLQKKLAEDKEIAEKAISESTKKAEALAHEKALLETLAPLTGSKREQMAILLSNVATEKLSEAYSMYIGRILKEDKPAVKLDEEVKPVATEVKTGDDIINESVVEPKKEEPVITIDSRLLKMAGIKAQV